MTPTIQNEIVDPKQRKSMNLFNFMSVGQNDERSKSKPKVVEVNRISFGRDMSAGAPGKRENLMNTRKINGVQRISRNSIVFPFTSKGKQLSQTDMMQPMDKHVSKFDEQSLNQELPRRLQQVKSGATD